MNAGLTQNHVQFAHKLGSMSAAARQQALGQHMSNPAMAPHVAAIMSDPTLGPIAMGAGGGGNPPPTHASAGTSSGTGGGDLNPKNARHRGRGERVQICGFGQQAIGSAATVGVSAIPYQWFQATRAMISAITISTGGDAGSGVSNWQVGTNPQFASLSAEPMSDFAASAASTFIDFDECQPSLSISAQVKTLASCTFYGALVGYVRGQAVEDRPAKTKVARLPIPSTSIAAGSTITVTTTVPTVDFWGRKLVLADAGVNQYGDTFNVTAGANGASGLLFQQMYVANRPQFLTAPTATATPYVPCGLFLGLYDQWLSLDKAGVSVPYTFQVYNPGTVTLLFAGLVEGDIAA